MSNCELFLDIAAHSRCITGLALDPTKSFFATCGEDGSINVWTTPKPPIGAGTPGQGEIDLLFNERGGSGIYTGIAWMQVSARLSLSFRFKGLFLYTCSVLFHVEWCIRQPWCSSIISFNINNITHNQYTEFYSLINI